MLPEPLFWKVHMYGVMVAVGILCALGVLYLHGKKMKVGTELIDFFFYDAVASIIFGFGFAAVCQAFYNYLENPEAGFHLDGGITFLGGMLGGAAFFLGVYYLRRKKHERKFIEMLSVFPCSITIAHGFGRIGCFFAGCCHGVETDSWLGIKFPRLPKPVYPTQLFEAAFLFILFGVLTYLIFKKQYRCNMPVYLMSYGAFRFLIEFIRGDDRGTFVGSLSPSQFWSVIMVIGGMILLIYLKKKDKDLREAEEYRNVYGEARQSFDEEAQEDSATK